MAADEEDVVCHFFVEMIVNSKSWELDNWIGLRIFFIKDFNYFGRYIFMAR